MHDLIARWPGKSATDGIEHPAIYHMLDVAAVAEHLIATRGFDAPLRDAMVLLVALHDLGKISATFRAMLRTGARQPQGRHWEITEILLTHHDVLLASLGGRRHHRLALYAATAGHHGGPPTRTGHDITRSLDTTGTDAITDACAVITAFLGLWPDASLNGLTGAQVNALSWWLPGLVAAADWVGSNTAWFPPVAPDHTPRDYLDHARDRAAHAVRMAGLDAVASSAAALFDFTPRPMQSACARIALPDGPTLAIIEDETGAGKTEAALMLAQRMMQAGKGTGLFFALPTTATADAMFRRAQSVVGRMFTAPPSLTLAHGRAAMSTDFRELVGRVGASDDPVCSEWLADNRRRALLATVGVGTVDQALLSVLPTRFSTLRHYGLSSKILIVDEVHELGEPYLAQELAQLLRAHRMAGGSAILLTATLPMDQRATLAASYTDRVPDSAAYPALTIAGGDAITDLPQTTGPRGPVAVRRLDSADAALQAITDHAAQGAACVWVRNAVDDAMDAVTALRAAGVPADLLHARFALCDRLRHEADALARFGKHGTDRQGRVLVATQVVESSLDLDFDVMVSDLAPMAALIQRAGRLWRHMDLRPADMRPVSAPVLSVVAPDPAVVDNAQWLHRVLDRGAWVYPADLQWRTADTLFRTGQIVAPSGLRALIESAHGPDAAPVPDALIDAETQRMGQGYAAANLARQNLVNLDDGFRKGAQAASDVDYPTRLGRPQQTLVLLRRQDGALRPWAGGTAPFAPTDWHLSEVTVAGSRLRGLPLPDQTTPDITALTADWPEWRRNSVILCEVADDGTICDGLAYRADLGVVFGE
ncbi:CRISPR-associated helicase Cas3' [Paracoccus sp. (in: a-proteobacteria)]|uniref:CRISPR-associated helicase Cas3' n=1 Tax=Paracoccus sp. TaxID=267 RepID=UPI0026DF6806|nr:CRISPR-associated helicase Cas3' [Paracoccus sp. (in: a-proteobacteria)]MDO5647526.1 CRISPR-associated helicase Cas3' [Paracoccus sp. (in: a-proteobacteria)]